MYTSLLRHVDFYIMPVMNVDGYDYTWKTVSESHGSKYTRLGYTEIQGELFMQSWTLVTQFCYEKSIQLKKCQTSITTDVIAYPLDICLQPQW